jgi:arylsulfatase A-like enzyme
LTAGFVANTSYCSYETGLDRGFAQYEDYSSSWLTILSSTALGRWATMNAPRLLSPRDFYSLKWIQYQSRDAREINRAFLGWLSEQGQRERPFFAFLNYLDAHEPFLVPNGRAGHFGLQPESRSDYQMLLDYWNLDKRNFRPQDVAVASDAYDDCIASLDEQVGGLLDELDHRGVLRDTVVVITSDHGEEFGEHGVFNHGFSLFAHELLVPLVIIEPASPPVRAVAEPVSLRDLPATVVDLMGLAGDPPFPGRSLAAHWRPESGADFAATPVLSEVSLPVSGLDPRRGRGPTQWGYAMSLVDGNRHYIRDSQGTEWLYDLASDPREEHNLYLSSGSYAELRGFRKSLLRTLTEDPIPPGVGEKFVKRYQRLLQSLLPAGRISDNREPAGPRSPPGLGGLAAQAGGGMASEEDGP